MNPTTFGRTILPSAPARDSITQAQVALNNFISQLREALQVIPEIAPAVPVDDIEEPVGSVPDVIGKPKPREELTVGASQTDSDATANLEREILARANALGTIIQAIDTVIDGLPSSSSVEDFDSKIRRLEAENEDAARILEHRTSLAERMQETVQEQIKVLANQIVNQDS